MWIDATSSEDELGLAGAVRTGGEEYVVGTCVAGIGSEAGVVDIVI